MQTDTAPSAPDTAFPPAAQASHASLIPATRQVARPDFRAALTAAFRHLNISVDDVTSFDRTKAFFRASGTDWTRALS